MNQSGVKAKVGQMGTIVTLRGTFVPQEQEGSAGWTRSKQNQL